ncbi:hypothetical protein MOJ78_12955 [Alkalihalobacillus sp. AL-G]|nr:hypothetical protein MOJ78_12955 [Alkalihalobacillus sp. AL-G]
MIDRCLSDYFGDSSLFPLTADEYEKLIDKISGTLVKQENEEVYTIVHDVIYAYLTQD